MLRFRSGGQSLWLALCIVGLSSVGCSRVSEPTSPKLLAKQFETFFGFNPPATITELRAKTVQIGDTYTDWISFRCDQAVFAEIANNKGLKVVDADEFWREREKSSRGRQSDVPHVAGDNPNAPWWWPMSPETSFRRLFYHPRQNSPERSSNHTIDRYFWRDDESGKVFAYYCMSG
jgi:hypothetical protein